MTSLFGPSYVRAIAPYIAGKPISEVAREFGLDEATIVKLASNENPLGMPESAKRAMALAAEELGRYPDSNGFELKAALSARYGMPPDWITLGNGSNDILEMAAHAFVEKGAVDRLRAVFVRRLRARDAGPRRARDRRAGGELRSRSRRDARRHRRRHAPVFVANPNNPTGTFIEGPELEAFLARCRATWPSCWTRRTPSICRRKSVTTRSHWVRRYPNLLVSRTFSKAFGLAGLRVGFAIAQPELTDLLNRLRQPFNVNSLAQAAAIAALKDAAFLEESAR